MQLTIDQWFDENQEEICAAANDIFQFAEVSEQESNSMKRLSRYLKGHGFSVETGVGGMSTSMRAIWGIGHPCIGFLGEYDALPGLFQPPEPIYKGNEAMPGHGCGHNLLGTGAAAAAVALRYAMEAENRTGQIVFYGCPAEEILKGKIIMAQNNCFHELDAALSWHPSDIMNPGEISYSAMDSIQFTFIGRASHAAAKPHLGRSTLDAVELMNIAANYLREHVTDDVRFHYCHIDCGEKPNIVPAKSKVWYYVRAKNRDTVTDTTNRLLDIARGAGLMTGTSPSWSFLSRGYETQINHAMCRLIYEAMCETALPVYTKEELDFARQLAKSVDNGLSSGQMNLSIPIPTGSISYNCGSTDLSDVSHIVPTGYFKAVCLPEHIPLHSWMATACAGMGIGQKGMLFAGRVLAKAGFRLMTDKQALDIVCQEFQNTGSGYQPSLELQ